MPHGDHVLISADKIIGYMLSETHPVGRSKARFFRSAGYTEKNWRALERELRRIAVSGETVDTIESDYGIKYVIQGMMRTPVVKKVPIITVWIVEKSQRYPRFVTAYPL